MTKNVTVTDTYGNSIGTTYPKRAKGLVKNGRASFVDDCTIRLSGKPTPSDILLSSEVKQMNYILLNPRIWSFEQTQYLNHNNFAFSGATPLPFGFSQGQVQKMPPANAGRSFITDFDGSLIESLMLGSWDGLPVSAVSAVQSLTPDTDYSFVFWLNGGENEKYNEVCQLQIIFFGNLENCYTYNLNRNYIKPLLHKDGWELYSIPFRTPEAIPTDETTPEPIPNASVPTTPILDAVIPTNFAFHASNAPMAVKPAKEPETYADWTDEPDEFTDERPQRHNIVFTDGWPSRSQWGGDKYSTEVLRGKKQAFAAANTAETKQGNHAEDLGAFTEQLEALEEQRDTLSDQRDTIQELFEELNDRAAAFSTNAWLSPDECTALTGRFNAFQSELTSLDEQLLSHSVKVDSAASVLMQIMQTTGSAEPCEGFLASLEYSLDATEDFADSMEDTLDSIEDYFDSIEDRHEA